uniref:Serine/threonine-protein phosphatase 2A activator n=1 Tax=Kalmanozyma brasiliensis (strain GHG001) TaxID=1365824 RepID=V5ETU1_KALBG
MPMVTPALRRAQAAPSSSSTNIAAASSSTATLGSQDLPPIPRIPFDRATLSRITAPVKKIVTEDDVERWKQSEAYSVYLLFLQRVCEASVGKPTRLPVSSPADDGAPLHKLIALLHQLDSWTDEIEPQSRPQRFGNLAFRDWGARLENRIDQIHADLLPSHIQPFTVELKAYLFDSFGSFTRIDYGSGHELAFFAWLGFLYRLGFFSSSPAGEEGTVADVEVEESLGLEVFPLYLHVVWRLQDRYGLEPAGSHGVWGLDDFQFLPYVIGAAQLRTQSTLRPAQAVTASSHSSILKDQLTGQKDPAALISTSLILPSTLLTPPDGQVTVPNLYLTSLLRIQTLKRGPFHEHSPLLHDIATTVPNWVKVYGGMVKMYRAECLSKKVVVQHFGFGGVGWVWSDAPVMATTSVGPAGGMGMALGGGRGNMGSMGVPTARVTGAGMGAACAAIRTDDGGYE